MEKKAPHLVRNKAFGGLYNDVEIALMRSLSKKFETSKVQTIVDALNIYEKLSRNENQLVLFKDLKDNHGQQK